LTYSAPSAVRAQPDKLTHAVKTRYASELPPMHEACREIFGLEVRVDQDEAFYFGALRLSLYCSMNFF
jgi:hypothetical protein